MRQKLALITQWRLLPAVCALCKQYHNHPMAICKECCQLMIPIKNGCTSCGYPLPDDALLQCGRCIKEPSAFDKVYTAYAFEEPLRTLLHQFKYQKALYLRTTLASFMLDAIDKQSYKPDCLIPVPLHSKRLKHRGFNQAAELAKLLGKKLKIPCKLSLCKKVENTLPQVNLSATLRRNNVRGVFQAKSIPFKHITLIDDLLTTGSTANELAKVFKQSGVERVDVWCLARALGKS